MSLTLEELQEALSRPFESDQISWRQGGQGKMLAYFDARDGENRLDEVCGIAGWQCRYSHVGEKTICEIAIKIDGEWIWKANGAGDTKIESEKGAISDAFKRACTMWGIGRYLYDLKGAPKVELKDGYPTDEGKRKLADFHDDACLKAGWGTRPGVTVYRFAKALFKHVATTPMEAQELLEQLNPHIVGMPVAMQRNLKDTASRVGADTGEAA